MGLFSSAKSYSGSAQKWAKPFAETGARAAQDIYSLNQGALQNQIVPAVNATIPQASQTFQGWNPVTEQAQGYYGDVLSGKYLDPSNNTALQSLLDRNTRDVTSNVNSQFAGAGRYGSAAHTDVLSRNLAESEGTILADQYNRERAMMDTAASTAPQLQGSSLAQLLQAASTGAEIPYAGTNALSSQLAALFSGGNQTSGGIGSQLIGALGNVAAGAAQAGAFGSDRRLKTNIELVGTLADGLGVYEFDYIHPPTEELSGYMPAGRHIGVMADEVEYLRPWALGLEVSGYRTVLYGEL